MFQIRNKILYVFFVGFFLLSSCLPQKMIYKPNTNTLVINDSIVVNVNEGNLLYNGNFHYSISFSISNKSHSVIYIDKLSYKMASIYKNITTPYVCNYLSDNVIGADSEKKVYIAFENNEDTLIISDYLANRKELKKNHHFVLNFHLNIGDSIVSEKIIFSP